MSERHRPRARAEADGAAHRTGPVSPRRSMVERAARVVARIIGKADAVTHLQRTLPMAIGLSAGSLDFRLVDGKVCFRDRPCPRTCLVGDRVVTRTRDLPGEHHRMNRDACSSKVSAAVSRSWPLPDSDWPRMARAQQKEFTPRPGTAHLRMTPVSRCSSPPDSRESGYQLRQGSRIPAIDREQMGGQMPRS